MGNIFLSLITQFFKLMVNCQVIEKYRKDKLVMKQILLTYWRTLPDYSRLYKEKTEKLTRLFNTKLQLNLWQTDRQNPLGFI